MAKKRATKTDNCLPPAFVDWTDIGPADFKSRQFFLKLASGFTHNIRLFHRPYKFWRRFTENRSSIITEEAANQMPLGVVVRYAINVIDRTDQQIKVLEASEKLFLEFRRCHELTGVELGGMDGFDIAIAVAGSGITTAYQVSYDPTKPTPFTDREKTMLKETRFDLQRLFAVSTAIPKLVR